MNYSITTPRFVVTIEASSDGLCRLTSPDHPALAQLRAKRLPPGDILYALKSAGINLLPVDSDAPTAKYVDAEVNAEDVRAAHEAASADQAAGRGASAAGAGAGTGGTCILAERESVTACHAAWTTAVCCSSSEARSDSLAMISVARASVAAIVLSASAIVPLAS